jgi:hypothetical protein
LTVLYDDLERHALSQIAVFVGTAGSIVERHLDYLLAESQPAAVMAREGCCAVRVPLPERFAVHKLIVSRLRVERGTKPDKDVTQASVLCAVLSEGHSGALSSALEAVPRRARHHLAPAIEAARRHLETAHPRAWEELAGR